MNVLFVLTSHDQLGNTGHKTGFWIEEFATPYYTLTDAGVNVTLASPKGGQPPIDPKSDAPENQTESTKRFKQDEALKEKLSLTMKLSDIFADEFDAIFFPGGHGPMWDLNKDPNVVRLVQNFYKQNKPVAAVCHGPAALLNAKGDNGEPLIKGKKVTGFTNTEEEAVQLTNVVPFLLEDALKAAGGEYTKKEDWKSYTVQDGLLLTGQNPASSEQVAKDLLQLLKAGK
ncbi:type 1 glutamine amidotransferase domain-containing protein [Segetibacter koreensis]|uniref:type 1 glutamine amidotransferase domain-containing protein n=1 Tax=Segetibacter koreensis TaxID=398037 RepID=UPI00035F46DE|nr:type 1 glutamine amidotransferase domain-containing protein [Segetibacter koreensis]